MVDSLLSTHKRVQAVSNGVELQVSKKEKTFIVHKQHQGWLPSHRAIGQNVEGLHW